MSDAVLAAIIVAVLGPVIVYLLSARKSDLKDLEARVAALEGDNRTLTDYAHELRAHIDDEKPPPPPPWPAPLHRAR